MRILTTALILLSSSSFGQVLSGTELLQKAIEYHDPNDQWNDFKGQLTISLTTPDGKNRLSTISIDFSNALFVLDEKTDVTIRRQVKGDDCLISLNGASDFTDAVKDKHRLTCERSKKMRDYYTYLYGLPMKLRDPGTIIHDQIEQREFKVERYNVLKVTYEASVGTDIWYFYFDIDTYEMKLYQFFHDEQRGDGEYILLSETEEFRKMKIPKERKWYTNKEDKYLGTDLLLTCTNL